MTINWQGHVLIMITHAMQIPCVARVLLVISKIKLAPYENTRRLAKKYLGIVGNEATSRECLGLGG